MIQTRDMGSRGMGATTLKNMTLWPWPYALLVLVTTAVASLPPIPEAGGGIEVYDSCEARQRGNREPFTGIS